MRRLNLGCGRDVRPGWVNLDEKALDGVDVVHDLNVVPLPFSDGEFDLVEARDVLEHLDYIPVLREIHRIMRPGATLHIQVPHFTSVDNFIDPTHRHRFSVRTFEFFTAGVSRRSYYFDFEFGSVDRAEIRFRKGVFVYNHVLEWLVNRTRRNQHLYETTGLCWMFPAANIGAVLVK